MASAFGVSAVADAFGCVERHARRMALRAACLAGRGCECALLVAVWSARARVRAAGRCSCQMQPGRTPYAPLPGLAPHSFMMCVALVAPRLAGTQASCPMPFLGAVGALNGPVHSALMVMLTAPSGQAHSRYGRAGPCCLPNASSHRRRAYADPPRVPISPSCMHMCVPAYCTGGSQPPRRPPCPPQHPRPPSRCLRPCCWQARACSALLWLAAGPILAALAPALASSAPQTLHAAHAMLQLLAPAGLLSGRP